PGADGRAERRGGRRARGRRRERRAAGGAPAARGTTGEDPRCTPAARGGEGGAARGPAPEELRGPRREHDEDGRRRDAVLLQRAGGGERGRHHRGDGSIDLAERCAGARADGRGGEGQHREACRRRAGGRRLPQRGELPPASQPAPALHRGRGPRGQGGEVPKGTWTQRMHRIMRLPWARELYRHRKTQGERPFAEIKQRMRFRRFSLRGKGKARGEWDLVSAAFNLLTIGRALEA